MKRKFFKIMGLVLIASIVMIAVVACNKPRDDQKTPPSSTEIVAKLPDMVDYGQAAYINVPEQNYSAADREAWIADLGEKQDEERGYWLLADETWDNDKYYSFAAIVDGERQHSYGYLAQDDSGAWYWEDSASANTVERIFCYSTPSAVIDKLAAAGVDRAHTNLMVEYISREDADREDYHGFTFEIGTSSAIDDYAQLEELEEMYNDWTESEIAAKSEFANSEEVSDAINLKNRKIYGEIFKIFGSEVDDFARTAIAMGEYAVEVIETVMMEAYKTHIDASELIISDDGKYPLYGRNYEEFVVYMRNEMYDYDSLSYLIAFREFTKMNAEYESGDKTSAMTLFGYHYQFKQRDYNVFDDSVTVEYLNETITEYEYFLKLSHESYFSKAEEAHALAYRDLDRRQYAEAYRYTTNCLTAYYQSQLEFQAIQEDVDAEIYVGGRADRFNRGISYFNQSTGTGKGSNTITYSSEMQQGLNTGLDATLKIGDVNYEYSGSDDNTLRMNLVSRQWNGLTDEQQQNPTPEQRYYKVEYEIELLNSQNYVLTHTTISDDDLTAALRYEIRSYSADSVRGVQQNKKNEVIYNIDIARMIEALDIGTNDSTGEYVMTPEQAEAYASLIETEGRGYAEYQNLMRNYSYTAVSKEIDTAANASWDGIRSNIATTLEQDYKNYTPVNNIQVDKYFEDTLIRKEMSCGVSSLDPCPVDGTHAKCEETYDTDWALSRLLNEHEKPLRYMYGQIEVTLARLNWVQFSGYNGSASEDAFFNASLNDSDYDASGSSVTVETIMTDEEIGTLLYKYNGDVINRESPINVPSYTDQGVDDNAWSTEHQGYGFTFTVGSNTYFAKFAGWYVDEQLQYEVLYDDTYNYDIRLYPAYYIIRGSN